jgi:hypothetical protein
MFTREAALELFSVLMTDGYAFDLEVIARAERLGHCSVELPIEWSDKPGGHVSWIRDSFRMLYDAIRLKLAQRT